MTRIGLNAALFIDYQFSPNASLVPDLPILGIFSPYSQLTNMDAASLGVEAFALTMKTYKIFKKALAFPETSEKLVLRLNVEHVRLEVWGVNTGLDQGFLRPGLKPFEGLIVQLLGRLTALFQDTTKLRETYGLLQIQESVDSSALAREQRSASFLRIKDAWRGIVKHDRRDRAAPVQNSTSQSRDYTAFEGDAKPVSALDRLRWALSSQSRFEELLQDIRAFTDNLVELHNETKEFDHEWGRTQIQMITRIEDQGSLRLVQDTTEGVHACQDMHSMALRKSLVVSESQPSVNRAAGSQDSSQSAYIVPIVMLRKEDFTLPDDFNKARRCVVRFTDRHDPTSSKLVLVEKKLYPLGISSEDRERLRTRLLNLIRLLNSSKRDRANLPLCMGYWPEPENHCWCLVYDVRFPPLEQTVPVPQSRSLLELISDPSRKVRPPLEHRIQLASVLAGVLSRLFGSQWLHKGIRSDNIVFTNSTSSSISTPLITGFEYSRQYTELASIDVVSTDVAQALYRHPDYQGGDRENTRYRIAYDVYSFGLILAEIALWESLSEIWHKRHPGIPSRFLEEQARDLRKGMIKKAERELAFKVGSGYQRVVLWCLNQSWKRDDELAAEFYSNVAAPLESIATRI